MRGPAFEALPGRKLEKMKENKAERSKKSFFSLCTGSQTGAKSSIFEHNSSDLVTEAFLDRSFVSQVRGLEATLRVRERVGPAAFETDSNGLSSEFGTGGHDASLRPVAAGSGILTNKCDLELDTVFKPALQRGE